VIELRLEVPGARCRSGGGVRLGLLRRPVARAKEGLDAVVARDLGPERPRGKATPLFSHAQVECL
jgi:hypothetical protein